MVMVSCFLIESSCLTCGVNSEIETHDAVLVPKPVEIAADPQRQNIQSLTFLHFVYLVLF